MTRSSQKPPASPEAQAEAETPATPAPASGTDGAPKASAVSPEKLGAAPDEAPVTGSPSATGTPSEAAAPQEPATGATSAATATAATVKAPKAPKASEASATAVGTKSGDTPAPAAGEAEGDTDPSASAAAQSRLPALVKTMSATAIGKPQPEAGPVGRPGKAALAGAAVVGALLVSVPFLVLAGNKDDEPRRTNTAAAGTVLDGNGQEAPGEFAVVAPETSAPPTTAPAEEKTPPKAANPVPAVPPAAPSADGNEAAKGEAKDDAPKDPPKKADPPKAEPKAQPKPKNQPAKAQPAVTFRGPFSFRSHLSGRCIDVPGHNFNDGQRLFMWDCNGADAQKWRIGSDGTIRARDKCLDVANAVFRNGTPIQLAWCNGSAAQKFDLNPAHDLVNTVVGMCVDIPNHSTSRGPSTYLVLWECTGLDNQKWSS
ncbi:MULTISPECIES: RICIN domain-containing protein [Streptomyces]|uniref:RICIN domain-containing protein n=1 Tax=Streptomyces TaxID=1883 RepID=UPI0010396E76|nr:MULTISPECIES: RICIN domain-containing protein [Streptomyces]MBT3072512.1 ricin-type beta-trefoil lectin domain protein [Streptomyces sp. COG21]MBT3080916.1 ricin-type beta-trefoil lectin domain protein [Streptomyces sp. COG20]MBT3086728.1 ricin-type beta-trefoil lectin domain protein [Streptomyces sp. CYG21]MBT3099925.1 ricin-type beta-trefoil lectin domain protein [Streptomyces sp. CBG30]MBT3102505.1 ricin-type beta-trefoil lectin domain protein [Streptomyces sp. COG19]